MTDIKKMTQQELNAFIAEDRRKHAERYKELEKTYKIALKRDLTPEERAEIEEKLKGLHTFRTEETPAKYCRPTHPTKPEMTEEEWSQAYKEAIDNG